jgi:hypothetical protein
MASSRPPLPVDEDRVDLSPGWLLSSFLVSTVGLALLVYGKRQTRFPHLLAGLALLLESAFLPTQSMLAGAGLALAALWIALRAGL